jgi:hypothetical protein
MSAVIGTNSAQFGMVVTSAAAANTAGLVLHHPYVDVGG